MSALIGIDWGTTSFRAYLFDQSSEYTEMISSDAGIMQERYPDFEAILHAQIGSWLEHHPATPIIASGMITSRQGWIETPYLACPASLNDLAASLTSHKLQSGHEIHFVAGISQLRPSANIMRGEETQMAGLASVQPMLAVLPGTHSKWIWMDGDSISRFTTFMTGELFQAITKHTILGRLMTDGRDPESFESGVREGFATGSEGGGILSLLFEARAKPILQLMDPDSVGDYISGLLLGTEIREAVALGVQEDTQPVLCGSNQLVQRYQAALLTCGLKPAAAGQDSASSGLWRIAGEAGLI